MKAKDQARKESEHISITDLELDDIGFSGPIEHKDSEVFNDFGADQDFDASPQPVSSPEVKRVSSYSNTNELEVSVVYSTMSRLS